MSARVGAEGTHAGRKNLNESRAGRRGGTRSEAIMGSYKDASTVSHSPRV